LSDHTPAPGRSRAQVPALTVTDKPREYARGRYHHLRRRPL